MKTLLPILLTVTLGLSGCKLDLDTHSVDRYRLVEAGGMVLRLNTETGEVAKITEAGVAPLAEIPTTLPPGWTVKQTN
ncbi:hypothetical protein LJR034_009113 [Caballeronia sp. LjRoot34]|uniref:hypothetical protein n=1 Tax=Caballeronia sp. LjRoot34 TaxID=3342325 RepID=UPI003ECC7743